MWFSMAVKLKGHVGQILQVPEGGDVRQLVSGLNIEIFQGTQVFQPGQILDVVVPQRQGFQICQSFQRLQGLIPT